MATIKSVRVDSHIDEVTAEVEAKLQAWLKAVGQDASSSVKKYIKDIDLIDTGTLRNSIAYKVAKDEHAVYIGTTVKYGKYQEYGTRTGIKPKHFLKTGVTAHQDDYEKLFKDILGDI